MSIKGGYILQPRVIDESEVSKYPPHIREIWFYLLRRANFIDLQINGKTIKRGQLFTSYSEIIDGLSWKIGFRKEGYKTHHVETAMKTLTKANMITKARTTRGIIVTICNYGYYQTPKNYENQSENQDENQSENHSENHPISKNLNNLNNSKNKRSERKEKNSLTLGFKNLFITDLEWFKMKSQQMNLPEKLLLKNANLFIEHFQEKQWKDLKDMQRHYISWIKIKSNNFQTINK